MRKGYLYSLVIAGIFAGAFFYFRPLPCDKPLTYKIGSVDSGFNLDKSTLLENINEASMLWNSAVDKTLFIYDPNGDITINFIYDSRQKAVELRQDIGNINKVAQSIKDEYQSKLNNLKNKEQIYQDLLSEYNSQIDAYNIEINNWNTNGGAPESQLKKLAQKKSVFVKMRSELDTQRVELNKLSKDVNQYADKFNILVRDINAKVDVVNENIGEIEEGFYTSKTQRIDIFQYENQTKLIRVLAHELGHAIGIDHNDNPESVMYKINQGNTKRLTPDDVNAIKAVCRL
jgi:predicted Zn-dependent protease